MEEFFLEWPDVAEQNLQACCTKALLPSQALWAMRSGEVNHLLIESSLLTHVAHTQVELEDQLIALGFLYFYDSNLLLLLLYLINYGLFLLID